MSESFDDALRCAGVPVIFSECMEPNTVLPEPMLSRPGFRVFICRSKEDLLRCIDKEFWKQLGIADPRITEPEAGA